MYLLEVDAEPIRVRDSACQAVHNGCSRDTEIEADRQAGRGKADGGGADIDAIEGDIGRAYILP